jgi:hypothetical protein
LYLAQPTVSRRLNQLIALWFVLQIVVPFTAPLQTLDIRDFLGGTTSRPAQRAPESSTTPTIRETSAINGVASLVPLMAPAVSPIAGVGAVEGVPLRTAHRPPPALPVRRSVLRL